MKKTIILISLLIFIASFTQDADVTDSSSLQPSDKFTSNVVDGVRYESGNWEHPAYEKPFKSLGNHRLVLKVKGGKSIIRAHIPWRRADKNPEKKGIVIVDVKTGRTLKNILVRKVNNEYGDLLFEPVKGSETYYVYYLPHESTGGYYPKVKYLPQTNTADQSWLKKYKSLSIRQLQDIPVAKVEAAQSIDDFHSFFPMEIIATGKEVRDFLKSDPKEFYLFPEYRENPIRMKNYLPVRWVKRGFMGEIKDKVKKGEFYTFQIGIYSPRKDLSDIKVDFSGLKSEKREMIPVSGIECFNTSGVDLSGKYFTKRLNVGKGIVQSLWFGIDISENIKPGKYRGKVTISAEGISPELVEIELDVLKDIIENHGDDDPGKMSRLRWLNSEMGRDKSLIIRPFKPVIVKKDRLKILGREIVIEKTGLPGEILSFFPQEMTYLKSDPERILSGPISFNILKKDGMEEKWVSGPYKINQKYKGEATWSVQNDSSNFTLKVRGRLEYDGMLNYEMELIAKEDVDISDIFLNVPLERGAARYMVGLGSKGGKRPKNISWKWDVNFHQEGVWLGNVNKGLQFVLRDENYERPLNTNFYHNKPLKLPLSWGNKGKGGISIGQGDGESVLIKNYSGPRRMLKGDILRFDIRFLITPFKLIDLKKHFQTRFVHNYLPVDEVMKLGGTVVNVHHATEINPFINYPFFNLEKQKTYIDEAHKKGIKVKLYNTIRELSYKAYELFALKSLGDEILNDGEGGGHSWLQEHFRSHYHSAWHATKVNDAAILNKGTSRWTNYYIEGLNWLAKNQKIDGLYLDDIAFSRETVKRITVVLNKHRDDVIIDLHSANQFNDRDGFINSVFLYMEHLPYMSRLWFGEYFEYDLGPDYWLTEVSGIPFGLTGEMLEKGGHPFRGMVYGMTNRVYGDCNPGELWKLFDEFDIAGSKMLGYWVDRSPVKTSTKNIRSTIYLNKNHVMIAIGSWSGKDEYVKLNIDWNKLGFNRSEVNLFAPEIKGLQKHNKLDPAGRVKVEKEKGIILILEKKDKKQIRLKGNENINKILANLK